MRRSPEVVAQVAWLCCGGGGGGGGGRGGGGGGGGGDGGGGGAWRKQSINFKALTSIRNFPA